MDRNEETALIARVRSYHDRHAFGRLVAEYQSPIRRFLLTQTHGNGQLADDLAQDTFVKAYTHIDSFQGRSAFSTWLFRIAYNVHYDYVRVYHTTTDLDTPQALHTPSRHDNTALRLDLQDALDILTPNKRTCITLQLMEGQPILQIAQITGIPENTIKSYLARGKHKMAAFLRANGYK